VLGLDPLPRRIELSREKTRPNLSFNVGDGLCRSNIASISYRSNANAQANGSRIFAPRSTSL
jgi:hypothetical protein